MGNFPDMKEEEEEGMGSLGIIWSKWR